MYSKTRQAKTPQILREGCIRILKLKHSEAGVESPIASLASCTNSHFDASAIEIPLTVQELSRIVPIHPVTILRWAREGRIPHRRLSPRKIIFLPSQINAWLVSGSQFYTNVATRAAQPERTAA
jgi:hypothetical protein